MMIQNTKKSLTLNCPTVPNQHKYWVLFYKKSPWQVFDYLLPLTGASSDFYSPPAFVGINRRRKRIFLFLLPENSPALEAGCHQPTLALTGLPILFFWLAVWCAPQYVEQDFQIKGQITDQILPQNKWTHCKVVSIDNLKKPACASK